MIAIDPILFVLRHLPRFCGPALLVIGIAGTAARAADPSAADVWPRLEAYYACGSAQVQKGAPPSIDGVRRACSRQLESYLEAVSFVAQMTNPRDMQRARPDDPVVVQKVAAVRAEVEAEFSRRVRELLK
jgi:hypothetical protein